MSYGRAHAIFQWASDNFQFFDAWCCVKGIDPLELPAYRFYNLVVFALKDGLTEEQAQELEQTLRLCDSEKHPLHLLLSEKTEKTKKVASTASPEKRHDYIPPWWRGEQANAKIAKIAMQEVSTLPKMKP